MSVSQILIICLAVIAGIVSYRQYKNGTPKDRRTAITWAFIVAYWIVLTLKNIADFFKL